MKGQKREVDCDNSTVSTTIDTGYNEVELLGEDIEDDASSNNIVTVVHQGILNTLCCTGGGQTGGTKMGENKKMEDVNSFREAPITVVPSNNIQAGNSQENQEGILSNVTYALLYMIGQAPPVQFIHCLEDASVDRSEVSLPKVLTDMAEDFDQKDRELKHVYERMQHQQLLLSQSLKGQQHSPKGAKSKKNTKADSGKGDFFPILRESSCATAASGSSSGNALLRKITRNGWKSGSRLNSNEKVTLVEI